MKIAYRFRVFSTSLCLLFLLPLAHATQLTLSADSSVSSSQASTNMGSLSNLYVGGGSTSLLQFSLSTLPVGTTSSQVENATLFVFVNRVNAAGTVTVRPVASASVALPAPTTAGTPSSRATIAAWQVRPP